MFRKSRNWMAAVCLMLGSCAHADQSGNGGNFSQYHNPKAGGFYHYGNFCGPGVPRPEKVRTEENFAYFQALKPVDDLDRACKAHDLCYIRYGSDTLLCDLAYGGLLYGYFRELGTPKDQKCTRLREELHTLVDVKLNHENAYMTLVMMPVSLITAGTAGLGSFVRNTASSKYGFPEQPGSCFFDRALNDFDARLIAMSRSSLNDLEASCYDDGAFTGRKCVGRRAAYEDILALIDYRQRTE